jgi:hypothetical protein
MYILFDHGDIDTERLEQYEVYGSWNNWKKSIKLEDYAFSIIVESIHACIIVYVYKINDESHDSNTIQYKIKYRNSAEGTFGDKYILIHNILTIHDNGFDNNKIIKQSSGHYFNGKYKYKNDNNKLELLYNNNLILQVDTVNGIPNGNGIYYDVTKNKIYEGNWSNGNYSGNGINYDSFGMKLYEGEWLDSLPSGHGSSYDNDGNKIYEGLWKNGLNHGFGIQYHKNSNKEYEGEWKEGCYCGHGISYDLDGNKEYEGHWKDNYKNGYGLQYDINSKIIYKGEWLRNKKNGVGTSFYSTEDGEYREHREHREYIGGWCNNERHGYGIGYDEDGITIYHEGMWDRNNILE